MSPPPDNTTPEALHWRLSSLETAQIETARLLVSINATVLDIKLHMASHAMPNSEDWANLRNTVDHLYRQTECHTKDINDFKRLHWTVIGGTFVIGMIWVVAKEFI